jgi:hypothetical protein
MKSNFFYTYYSYEETPGGRGYIGSRGSVSPPLEDTYFGSYRDQDFNPTRKVILGTYETRIEAYMAEVSIHTLFNVDKNEHFANRSKAKPGGFLYSPKGKKIWSKGEETVSSDSCPGEGWVRGFPKSRKREGKSLGTKLWYNPDTMESGFFKESPPQGWILGMPEFWREKTYKWTSENNPYKGKCGDEHHASGTEWWVNPLTGETRRVNESPGTGWEPGRGELGNGEKISERNKNSKWFTDGKGNEKFCEKCPEGWRRGRAYNPNSQMWVDPYDNFVSNAGGVSQHMRKHGRDPSEKKRLP